MNCLSPVVHAHLNHPQSAPPGHSEKNNLIENTYTVDVASRGEGSDLGDVGERQSVEACREVCAQLILCTMAQWRGGSPGLTGWLELVGFFRR